MDIGLNRRMEDNMFQINNIFQPDTILISILVFLMIMLILILDKVDKYEKKLLKNQRKDATKRIGDTSDIIVWASLRENCIHLHNDGRVCLKSLTDCLFVNCPIKK